MGVTVSNLLMFVNHYHAQLGLLDKSQEIKGLVVCYVAMKGIGLRTYAWCVCLVPCCGKDGHRAQVPQHPIKM